MNMMRFAFLMCVLVLSACSPRAWQPIDTSFDRLGAASAAIDRARAAGAELCAPDAMSDAQTAFYYAAHELSEGQVHPEETSGLIATAEKRASDAYHQSTQSCQVATVYFDYNSDQLTSRATSTLNGVAGVLNGKAVRIQLAGHTDNRGSDAFNLDLSKRRAVTVKRYLSSHGVRAGQMAIKAYGESRPAASNRTEAGRAKNRRVEIWRLK